MPRLSSLTRGALGSRRVCIRPRDLNRVTQLCEKRWSLKMAYVVTLAAQDQFDLIDVFSPTRTGKLKRTFDRRDSAFHDAKAHSC